MTTVVTPGSAELLALADRLAALSICIDHNTPQRMRFVAGLIMSERDRDVCVVALRLAAKPDEDGVSAQDVMDSRNKQFGFAWDLNEAICDAIDDGKTESRDIAARVTTNPKIKEWLKLLPMPEPPSTTGKPKRCQ